jgi:hypothetical protein
MGLLSLNLPVIGQSSATEDQKVRDALAAIQTDYNGNLTDANISATAGIQQSKLANGATGLAVGTFAAYRATAVALATGGTIVFDTEEVDVSGWFDTTTGRYTPQAAGYYRLSAAASTNAVITAGQFWGIELFKNGSLLKRLQLTTQVTGGGTPHASGSHPVVANGSTDFFDIRVNHNTAASPGVAGGAAFCYFGGEMIGRS